MGVVGFFFGLLSGLGLAALGFELFSARRRRRRLGLKPPSAAPAGAPRRGLLGAVLAVLWPARFDPARAPGDLAARLRRSGYYYPTVGDYYAARVRDFGLAFVVGIFLPGALAANFGLPAGLVAAPLALLFAVYGARRTDGRLRRVTARRAEALPFGMLPVLVVFRSLLAAGVDYQEALRRAAAAAPEGAVFAWVVRRLLRVLEETGELRLALAEAEADLPDPADPHARGFLRALALHGERGYGLLEPTDAVIRSLSRELVERTEARAAVIRQRAGLFGVFAVLGMVFSVVAPALLGGFLTFGR